MKNFVELAYLRMREIVAILERELEQAEMVAYYAREPIAGGPVPGGSLVHHEYMADRARRAVAQAKAALAEIQVLAYERGVAVELPEIV